MCDTYIQDLYGKTPLHYAAENGHGSCITALVNIQTVANQELVQKAVIALLPKGETPVLDSKGLRTSDKQKPTSFHSTKGVAQEMEPCLVARYVLILKPEVDLSVLLANLIFERCDWPLHFHRRTVTQRRRQSSEVHTCHRFPVDVGILMLNIQPHSYKHYTQKIVTSVGL